MGIADVIPGVSGGTMALILGIYARLIASIRRVDTRMVVARFCAGKSSAMRCVAVIWLCAGEPSVVIFGAVSHDRLRRHAHLDPAVDR